MSDSARLRHCFGRLFGDDGGITSIGGKLLMGHPGNVAGAEWLEFSDRQIRSNQATLDAVESASISSLNNYRSSSSRSILSTPADLTTFAENWSRTMASNGLGHSSASSRRGLLTGGRTTVGENVAQVPDTGQSATEAAQALHRAWVNSSTHRANMLSGNFSEVGIGIVRSGGYWWGTHVFAG